MGPGPRSLLPSLSFLPLIPLSFCLFLFVYLYCSIFTILHTLQFYSSLTLPYPPVFFPFFFYILSLPPLFFPSLPIGRTHNLRYDPALAHRGYRNWSVVRYVRAHSLFYQIICHLLSFLDYLFLRVMFQTKYDQNPFHFIPLCPIPSSLTYRLTLSCTLSLSPSYTPNHTLLHRTVLERTIGGKSGVQLGETGLA